MEFNGILKNIVDRSKKLNKKIVLPESEDIRVLQAANIAAKNKIAKIILIGNKNKIKEKMKKELGEYLNEDIEVIDPDEILKKDEYINEFYNIRKDKGISMEDAKDILNDYVYFAAMMLKQGDVDGVVSGASHSSADTLRPALQIIKAKTGVKCVSSFFLMETDKKNLGQNGVFVFSDCGLVIEPTKEELLDIAVCSAETFKYITQKKAKLAFLSFSTKGSGKSSNIDKVNYVMSKLEKMNPDFEYDGELQLDAAIIPDVAEKKAKNSKVAGKANVLIFPNLDAGNIGYKIAQRFGGMLAIGPITQGLNKPMNDLSRGCKVEDIVGAIAITALQAEN